MALSSRTPALRLVAGTTPFLRAAKGADIPAMQLLLEHGADAHVAPKRACE
jgi:hypothetical protein